MNADRTTTTTQVSPSGIRTLDSGERESAGSAKRAVFDFSIEFTNGGGIQGQDFRLDIYGNDIDDTELAASIVRDLRLLMVKDVRILRKRIITEAHKRADGEDRSGSALRYVELSHTIEDGMTTYPGLPVPVVDVQVTREASAKNYEGGTTFEIGRVQMVGNTGTYLDTPFHRFADGADLADLPLDRVAGLKYVTIDATGRRAITPELLVGREVRGRAVLLRTNWDSRFGTAAYAVDTPYLTSEAAQYLAEHGAALVGIDALNIDDTRDRSRPAHTILLRAGIPILEHLRGLGDLPQDHGRFFAVPVKMRRMGTFPVRAFVLLEP